MGRSKKTVVRMYSAWNYEKETEDLNRYSDAGWQLTRGGLFLYRFERNERLRYRYQLDYQPGVAHIGRYLETYYEQGWEFVSRTWNGWYYFRKAYDPALPSAEYEIFTDRESLMEMNRRWANLGRGLLIVLGVFLAMEAFGCIVHPNLPGMVVTAALAAETVMIAHGYFVMRSPERSKNDRYDSIRLLLVFLVLIVGFVSNGTLYAMRPAGEMRMSAEEIRPIAAQLDRAMHHNTVEIRYADNYYLDLELAAQSDVTFSIVDSKGAVVFETRGKNEQLKDVKLRLPQDTYRVIFSDYAGGRIAVCYRIQ